MQKDIAALTAQSEDDSLSAVKRQQAEAKLALTRPQFDHALQRWSKLEKEVRTQELPHDWIEPVPPQVSNPK